jgi:DNA-binding HxlR family transcriptional regulator
MGILSKKWALLIISAIGNNQRLRYNELEKKLDGISPKTLAERLRELEDANIIKREAFAEIPPRVEYSLTKDGVELRNAIIPLMKWALLRDIKI